MNARLKRRKLVNAVMLSLTAACAGIAICSLFFILGYLAWKGGRDLSWTFLTRLPKPVGEAGGGMANAIVGSGQILLLAALMGLPVGLLGGIYLAEFAGRSSAAVLRYTADLLNGVPSIVVGIFVYTIVVVPMRQFSAFSGGFALGVMLIPIALRTVESSLAAVPQSLREGAMALGAHRWRTVATVVLPAASRGVITGMLLALARVAGETAPLLFTSFGNRFWSSGWDQPTASLPVMIFTYAISAYDDWHRQAWAAGLVLLVLVLSVNTISRLLLGRGKPAAA